MSTEDIKTEEEQEEQEEQSQKKRVGDNSGYQGILLDMKYIEEEKKDWIRQ